MSLRYFPGTIYKRICPAFRTKRAIPLMTGGAKERSRGRARLYFLLSFFFLPTPLTFEPDTPGSRSTNIVAWVTKNVQGLHESKGAGIFPMIYSFFFYLDWSVIRQTRADQNKRENLFSGISKIESKMAWQIRDIKTTNYKNENQLNFLIQCG